MQNGAGVKRAESGGGKGGGTQRRKQYCYENLAAGRGFAHDDWTRLVTAADARPDLCKFKQSTFARSLLWTNGEGLPVTAQVRIPI
jgi:hypothetical protein